MKSTAQRKQQKPGEFPLLDIGILGFWEQRKQAQTGTKIGK